MQNKTELTRIGYSKSDIDEFINIAWKVLRENDSTIPSDVLDAFKRVLQDNLEQDQFNKTSIVEWNELSKGLPPFDKDGFARSYRIMVQLKHGTVCEADYWGGGDFYLNGRKLPGITAWALMPKPCMLWVQDSFLVSDFLDSRYFGVEAKNEINK